MRKTKEDVSKAIKDAFIHLLEKQGFSAITISDITREAHINRSTFYNYFIDKFDLIEQYEKCILEEMDGIIAEIITNNIKDLGQEKFLMISYDVSLKIALLLDSERPLVKALLSENGDPNFLRLVKNSYKKILRVMITDIKHDLISESLPIVYKEEVVFSSIAAIFAFWISEDQEETPEMIAKYVSMVPFPQCA